MGPNNDFILHAGPDIQDIILTTRNNLGYIRMATTEQSQGPDKERFTISPWGNIGFLQPAPKEMIHMGDAFTLHTGSWYSYLSWNQYNNSSGVSSFIEDGFGSTLFFQDNGYIYLGSLGKGNIDDPTSHNETRGGLRGIGINYDPGDPLLNIPDQTNIGIGTAGWGNSRLTVLGFGNDETTITMQVMNSDQQHSLYILDNRNISIGGGIPTSRLMISASDASSSFSALNIKDVNQNSILFVRNDGNIGIRVTSPDSRLVVRGMDATSSNSSLDVQDDAATSLLFVRNDGNVGIGDNAPTSRLVIVGKDATSGNSTFDVQDNTNNSLLFVRNDGNVGIGDNDPEQKLVVNGKVRIGTRGVNPASSLYAEHMLSVDGTIITDKVVVTASEWADFVFDEDYELMSLYDLEKSININKHLPGIPSEEVVNSNGVDLGEMQTLLLQKIEELTLYVIDLKKENDILKKRFEMTNSK